LQLLWKACKLQMKEKANASQQAADLQKLETELYDALASAKARFTKSFHEFAEAGKDH